MKVLKVLGVSVFALFALLSLSTSVSAQPSAGSYDVNINCGSFSNDQAAAQEYFDANDQPANLDQNGDGLACADPEDGDFTGGPSAGSYDVNVTCDDFSNDAVAAQAYFDENDSPVNLDQNGDGIACNDEVLAASDSTASTTSATVASLPNTGSGPSQGNNALIILMSLAAGVFGAAVMVKRSKA